MKHLLFTMRTKPSYKPDVLSEVAREERSTEVCSQVPVLAFKHILVPVDFSACSVAALDYGLAMADKFSAKVTLLHVVEPAAYPDNYLHNPAMLDEANQNLMAAGRERLARFEQGFKGHGVAVDTLVRMGRAQSEISDTAKAIGTDLIVLGTQGFTGPNHVPLGGTIERVVRYAPCPVLTVR
jgi:nucleotide-binding universal stress UspA family protein